MAHHSQQACGGCAFSAVWDRAASGRGYVEGDLPTSVKKFAHSGFQMFLATHVEIWQVAHFNKFGGDVEGPVEWRFECLYPGIRYVVPS